MNVEGDRLSSLPDDLIHKILSFLNITEAINTSALSPRWRYLWKSMPYLSFSSEGFTTLPKFSKFVTKVLSLRDNLTEVYSVRLSFRGKTSQAFVKKVLKYSISHNVQQLNVECFVDKEFEFPLSVVSSQSLKHLSLRAYIINGYLNRYFMTRTSRWELPALTTLDLHSVALYDDKLDKCVGTFSKFPNMKNLTLKNFKTTGSDGFIISHPRLSNLTLEHGSDSVKVVNVVAPQLENLTIRFCYAEHVISAPHLASLFYKGTYPLHLTTDDFHSLEKADVWVSSPRDTAYWSKQSPKKVAMSTELKSYLLDGSPNCTFTTVLREEIAANKLMVGLGVLLRKEKDNMTNSAQVERKIAPAESHIPKKLKKCGDLEQIKGYWENLSVQNNLRKNRVCSIVSKLQRIEKLLTKLPASNRSKMQPCFSSLCAEAKIAISNITNSMKIECDENQSRLSACLDELATTTLESSP